MRAAFAVPPSANNSRTRQTPHSKPTRLPLRIIFTEGIVVTSLVRKASHLRGRRLQQNKRAGSAHVSRYPLSFVAARTEWIYAPRNPSRFGFAQATRRRSSDEADKLLPRGRALSVGQPLSRLFVGEPNLRLAILRLVIYRLVPSL